jgi:hypothetical protein
MKRLLFKKRSEPVVLQKPLPSLKLCLLLDAIGCVFIFVPFVGELFDILWAPVSAFLFYRLFGGGKRGILGGVFSFVEEVIPGLNFIPTFTIAWCMAFAKRHKNTTFVFRPFSR